ncbi:hypothetical protein FB45DRAFT_1067730, partial [Roridomyces roridus]
MSRLSLPVTILSQMEISIRVCLPDGSLSFDMGPGPFLECNKPSLGQGMKLEILSKQDSDGVTITLSAVANDSPSSNTDPVMEDILVRTLNEPVELSPPCAEPELDHDAIQRAENAGLFDFLDYLDLDNLPTPPSSRSSTPAHSTISAASSPSDLSSLEWIIPVSASETPS